MNRQRNDGCTARDRTTPERALPRECGRRQGTLSPHRAQERGRYYRHIKRGRRRTERLT
jgi:hypothetical protein